MLISCERVGGLVELQGDTPEDLLDGTGKGLGGVARLSSSEADQLSTGEREGGCDKDTTEASGAVLERAGIIPELGTLICVEVAGGGTATTDKNDGDNHEDDNGSELEDGTPELFFGIAQGTKDVDDNDEYPEDCDPDSFVDVFVPILYRERDDC